MLNLVAFVVVAVGTAAALFGGLVTAAYGHELLSPIHGCMTAAFVVCATTAVELSAVIVGSCLLVHFGQAFLDTDE